MQMCNLALHGMGIAARTLNVLEISVKDYKCDNHYKYNNGKLV